MEQLTKAEEKVMQILWKLKSAFVKDIIDQMPDPKPPYNTISSVVRILREKGFVDFKAYGKTYEYFPAISNMADKKYTFGQMLRNYFDGSYETMVSYMVDEESISDHEISEIKQIIDKRSK